MATKRFLCCHRLRTDGLFSGCAATRPISDVALGAGGAYLGHEISNGDLLVTAAGAAGGVIVSETLHYAAKKQSDKAYAAGYDKGKSDPSSVAQSPKKNPFSEAAIAAG